MSSRQSRMTSGERRMRMPPAPMQKTMALTPRYQEMLKRSPTSSVLVSASRSPVGRPLRLDLGARLGLPERALALPLALAEQVADADRAGRLQALAPAGEDDRADGRDQQQERRDLEGQQELGQQQLADLARRPEAAEEARAVRVQLRQAGAEDGDQQLDEQRAREQDGRAAQRGAGRGGEVRVLAA